MIVGRRAVVRGLSAIAVSGLGREAARAGEPEAPRRQVNLLLGSTRGSGPDRIARDFAAALAPRLPNVVLSLHNVTGDGGYAMLTALAGAPPDGSTLGWVMTPTVPARMIDHGDSSILQRIRLIGQIEREPLVFVSPASDPATAIQDIVRRSGDDADAVPLGTPPPGSPPHLAAMRLQVLAQTQLNIVTFPSPAATRQAVLAGNVSAAALALSEVIDDIRDGDLTALGIAARRRFGLLPDTPVLDEGGIPLAAFIRRGLAVPAGTPPDVTAMWLDALHELAADTAFQAQAEGRGYYVVWKDDRTWLDQLQTERAVLQKLWQTDPWLSWSGG